jgi:hypothetical protein
MSGLSILIIVVIVLLLWNGFQRRSGGRSAWSRAGSRGGAKSERQLVKAVGRPAASRLIAQLQQRNPDRSREWCADKALFDWERDRRY